VVDFWAEWCGPCRVIAPIFEKFAVQFDGPNIAFYKVDVDEASDIAQEVQVTAVSTTKIWYSFSNQFLNLGCGQMPTFMAFKGGEMIGKSLGADPRKLEVRTYIVLDDKWLINTLQALIQDVNKLNAEN